MTIYFLNSADYDLLQDSSTREAFEEVLYAGHSVHATLEGAQQAALAIEREIYDDIVENDEPSVEPSLTWEASVVEIPGGEVRTWRTEEEHSVGGLVYLIRAMELGA